MWGRCYEKTPILPHVEVFCNGTAIYMHHDASQGPWCTPKFLVGPKLGSSQSNNEII